MISATARSERDDAGERAHRERYSKIDACIGSAAAVRVCVCIGILAVGILAVGILAVGRESLP